MDIITEHITLFTKLLQPHEFVWFSDLGGYRYKGIRSENYQDINKIFSVMMYLRINTPLFEIVKIYIADDYRRKGLGTQTLLKLVAENTDKVIFVSAGYDPEEYGDLETNGFTEQDWKDMFNKLIPFYTKCGFVRLHSIEPENTHRIPFIWPNEAGRKIIAEDIRRAENRNVTHVFG